MSEEHKNHHEELEEITGFDSLDRMTLSLDDGSQLETGVLGIFELAGEEGQDQRAYIALLTREEEVLLYRYAEVGEEEIDLDLIESREEHQAVKAAFEELFLDGESLEEVQ